MNENQNEVKNENKKNGCLAEAKRFWSGIGHQFKEHKMLKVVAGTAIGVVGAAAVTVAGVLVVKKIKGKAEGYIRSFLRFFFKLTKVKFVYLDEHPFQRQAVLYMPNHVSSLDVLFL